MKIGRGQIAAMTMAGFIGAMAACSETSRETLVTAQDNDPGVLAGEAFIDAFYGWDAQQLAAAMNAPEDEARVLYYQAWAQAGNYQIQTRRRCARSGDGRVACAITVTDDIGAALGYVATDTFLLATVGERIVGVEFVSDDPPVLEEVFAWIGANRPEVLAGPCKDLFTGGTTPAACVRAVVQAAEDFAALGSE